MKRLWLALLLALAAALVGSSGVLAQDKTLYWERYDVNLDVQTNGDILVEEIQQIVFTSGTFQFGYAAIPLDRLDRITDVSLAEIIDGSERAYSPSSTSQYGFTTGRNEGNLEITWYFPPTRNTDHTYILRYRVVGGLRIYQDGDQVWWKAVPPDHNFPIRSSRVTVSLPQRFAQNELKAESYGAQATEAYDQGQVIFEASNIPAGQELEVRVQFPHGVVQASAPDWQAAVDRQQQWGPVVGVIGGGLGLVLLIAGPVAVYLLWYSRGRDQPVGLVAEYITEPPSDLPAGVVGTLIDEKADLQDIIATIPDLARRGALRMEEERTEGFLGIGSGRDYVFHLVDDSKATRPFEQTLLRHLFGGGESRRMSDLRQRFYTALPGLYGQLYDEVVRAGFFPASPQSTRQRWSCLGIAGLIVSGGLAFLLLAVLGNFSALAACPGAALAVTAIALMIVGYHMPRKTPQGAEEAAKWLAFKRYLQTIEKHGNLETARSRFEEFLPYAIVFGLERSFIQKFAAVDTPAPSWWGPVWLPGHGYGYGYPHQGGSLSTGPAGGPPGSLAGEGGGMPTLTGMSEGVGNSLASMSNSLGAMLSAAGSTFVSTPAPQASRGGGGWSGGGWSGGGFSGGGGGGGGSRGFG